MKKLIRLAIIIIKWLSLYNLLRICKIRLSTYRFNKQDKKMVEFYSEFIKRGDLTFDIGANLGNRTKIFSYLSATVIAVEPQDLCINFLKVSFLGVRNVKIIKAALGEKTGNGEICVCSSRLLSSLSNEWIEKVKKSGRFPNQNWDRKQPISIITLDYLINKYGTPSFIKIDVEGYEYEVLRGLTKPTPLISFEFTPEYIESTIKCIKYLATLGKFQLNYSLKESMALELRDWLDNPDEAIELLMTYRENNVLFGDIYVRFKT